MDERFPDQSERLHERAAGPEDAFDAAVSALVMSQHLEASTRYRGPRPTTPGGSRG